MNIGMHHAPGAGSIDWATDLTMKFIQLLTGALLTNLTILEKNPNNPGV